MSHSSRFKAYVGFVSPPASFDFGPQDFVRLCADPVGVLQHQPPDASAAYGAEVGDGTPRLAALREAIAGLKASSADLVAQIGGYWSLAYAPSADVARDLQDRLSDEAGLPVLLVWQAVVDALHALDARRIAVTSGYYRPQWTAATVAFLESAGFEILWAGDIVDQGLVADQTEKEAIERATRWDYPDAIVHRTCVEAARRAPECDVILQTGSGMHVVNVAAAVEDEAGKPVVATDTALYWAILKATGTRAQPGHGRLLEST